MFVIIMLIHIFISRCVVAYVLGARPNSEGGCVAQYKVDSTSVLVWPPADRQFRASCTSDLLLDDDSQNIGLAHIF